MEDVRQKIIDNIPRRRQYEVNPKTLVLYLKGWAGKKKDYGYFASYKRLVTVALDMRVREAAASLPAVSSTSLKTGLPKGYDRKKTPLSVKLKTMRRLRRAASPYTRKEKEVADFRDTSKMATLSSKEHTASFSIGHTGNFLLGLMQEHDYKDLCAKAKSTSGLDDTQVAVRLLNHLQGEKDAFEGLSGTAKDYCVKIVALFIGPEFRRAGGNPVAAIATLNQVIARSSDLYETLLGYALFVKSGGGSARSQFHRVKVDETESDFQKVAANEYDAFIELALTNGVDAKDEKALDTFYRQLVQNTLKGLKTNFTFGLQ